MRRLGEVTIEVEDRFQGGGKPRAKPRKPESRPRRRFPLLWTRRARRLTLFGLTSAALVILPAWLVLSGTGRELVAQTRTSALGLSVRAGFRVGDVYVEGRNRTPREDLVAALNINRGDPILGIDLKATRERLEEISWVRSATLERRLPTEIRLVITERDPIALWQNQGRYYLIDRSGLVVGDEIEEMPHLPLVVGEGAPDHIGALLDMLASEPGLAAHIKASQWVSGRRWNLTLTGGEGEITVRLPENDPDQALHELARMERDGRVLERKVALIDLRLPDRQILRASPDAVPTLAPAHAGKAAKTIKTTKTDKET